MRRKEMAVGGRSGVGRGMVDLQFHFYLLLVDPRELVSPI
jgi:hypothetical protein